MGAATSRRLGLLLSVCLAALLGACAPSHSTAPCTKSGVSPSGVPDCPLTGAQVAALPDSQIYYPGSQVIRTWSYGGSGDVNGEPTPAVAVAVLNTPATQPAVTVWYQNTLQSSGWFKADSSLLGNRSYYQFDVVPPQSVYAEYLSLDFAAPQGDATLHVPDVGTTYTVRLEVVSPSLP